MSATTCNLTDSALIVTISTGGAALAAWGREYHQEAAQYLSEMAEADNAEPASAMTWIRATSAPIEASNTQ